MGINVTGINHVIVAVEDLEAGIETFGTIWGLSLDHLGEAPELGIKAAYFNVGDAILELVTPYDDSESNFVRKHIERRGEGLYMFCVRVDDMAAAIADLRAKGCTVTDPIGNDEVQEAFVSPRNAHGVRMQLLQRLK